ncbi:DUF305 domain-containing protein [Kribbella sp. NPDC048915]|uniref:DUF305 domain-containing protein n=1 Tax=Kribbella sp. NPDC048915 TaxID=3155148 RepID=UPI0033F8FFB9
MFAALTAATLLCAAVTACGTQSAAAPTPGDDATSHTHPTPHAHPTADPHTHPTPETHSTTHTHPSTAKTLPADFNTTDAAWLQLMIPMNEQFLQLLDLTPTHSHDPAVRRLAATLAAAHRTEIAALKALRAKASLPATNIHAGHDMPGMLRPDELDALSNLHGPAFDKILTAEIHDHLQQSAKVIHSVKTAGKSPTVKSLAIQIEKTRTIQLTTARTTLPH